MNAGEERVSLSRKRKTKVKVAPGVPVKRRKPGRPKKVMDFDIKTPSILTFFKPS